MWRLSVLLILLLPGACSWVPSASDPDNIALIVALEGNPYVLRDGITFDVEPNVALHVGDAVLSKSDDQMTLRMQDGTLISLAGRSELVFHLYGDEGPAPLLRLSMGRGTVRVTAADSLRKHPIGIEFVTPMADLIIKSGDLMVDVRDELSVRLASKGRVVLRNPMGEVGIQQAGQGVITEIGQAPGEPVTLGSTDAPTLVKHLR